MNVRSLKSKEHYILAKDLAKKHKLDIFTISESWLTYLVSDLEVKFPGFSLFRLDRNYKIGGGVCAYVKNNLKCVKLADLSYISDTGLHQLWLKVQVKNFKSFIISTAYRTDDVPVNCFKTDLSFMFTSAMTFNVPIFILGDLNYNLLRPSDPEPKAVLDFCNCFNLTQVINKPRRITQLFTSLLNVILTNNKYLIMETKVVAH